MREKLKMPDGLAPDNPFRLSYKAVTDNSSLAPATAMVRVGTIAVRTVTTGRLRSTRLRTVGT